MQVPESQILNARRFPPTVKFRASCRSGSEQTAIVSPQGVAVVEERAEAASTPSSWRKSGKGEAQAPPRRSTPRDPWSNSCALCVNLCP